MNLSDCFDDPDFIIISREIIESELSNLKRIVDKISQMRVQASYLVFDMMSIIDADNWRNISEMIGLSVKTMDVLEEQNI
ncbi:hypothetical protein KGM_211714 [Danaus plexippus plexippus]|uniref:Uncharacterized protein n=1 Tax=Danaus plexippus plexippus TaxID=278856 RepID=A0A212FFW3_DANPL|nr:hypothetical protein KGM_211714 [Danaus plexippus plexippus]